MTRLFIAFFFWSLGIWIADVMGDSLVAERAKYESSNDRGTLQIVCYICRGIGFVLFAPISSIIYCNSTNDDIDDNGDNVGGGNNNGPFIIILTAAILPLFLVPFIYIHYMKGITMTMH